MNKFNRVWKKLFFGVLTLLLILTIFIGGYFAGYNGTGAFWLDEITEVNARLKGQWINRDSNGDEHTLILFGDGTFTGYILPHTVDTEVIGTWAMKEGTITFRSRYRNLLGTSFQRTGPGFFAMVEDGSELVDASGRRFKRVPVTQSMKWNPITINPMAWDAFRFAIGSNGRLSREHLPIRPLPKDIPAPHDEDRAIGDVIVGDQLLAARADDIVAAIDTAPLPTKFGVVMRSEAEFISMRLVALDDESLTQGLPLEKSRDLLTIRIGQADEPIIANQVSTDPGSLPGAIAESLFGWLFGVGTNNLNRRRLFQPQQIVELRQLNGNWEARVSLEPPRPGGFHTVVINSKGAIVRVDPGE